MQEWYSRASKGMGLVFTDIETGQLGILETWLAESRETSWLAANRRRSQRVLMTIPVRVSGKTGAGSPFEEATHTRAISAHGALILVRRRCTEDSVSLCQTSRQKLHWSV